MIAATLALLGLAGTTSAATLIYSDDFNRSGALNGSSPTIGSEAPSWAAGTTWISSSSLTTNGSAVSAPEGTNTSAYSINAYLPADISVNSGIYTLTITYAATWWGSNNWLAVGFATSTAGTDGSAFFTNAIGMVTYNRGGNATWGNPSNLVIYGSGATSIGSLLGVNQFGATPLTLTITLDTYATTDNYTVTTQNAGTGGGNPAVRSITGTLSEAQINSINAIKIGSYQGQPGTFDNLVFTVVPEPSTLAMTALGLCALFWNGVRQKRRRIAA